MKLAPLVLALLLAACSSGDSPTGNGSYFGPSIVPLKVGNSWWYDGTRYDVNGRVQSTHSYTLWIPQDTLLNNENCYFIDAEGTLGVNRSDGLWGFDLGTARQYLVLRYPASRGQIYTTGSQWEYTITVHSIDTTVTVASGTYSCYLYVGRHVSGTEIHALVAPNKGIVEAEVFEAKQSGGAYLALRLVLVDMQLE